MKKAIFALIWAAAIGGAAGTGLAQSDVLGAYTNAGVFHTRDWWCENYSPAYNASIHPEFECGDVDEPRPTPPAIIYGHVDRFGHWHSERFYVNHPGWE